MNFFRRPIVQRILFVLALALLGAGLCAWLVPAERHQVAQQLLGFPESDVFTHKARPWVIIGLCFLPFLASLVYQLGDTLDRYITRQFLLIFSICLGALFIIWFLIDLTDNIGDFHSPQAETSGAAASFWIFIRSVFKFYASRSPSVFLLLLPYSLLLSLLYSLGKLSSTREMIAVIQSGRGVLRATFPLIIAGIFCTLLSMGLNYHWAPIAEASKDEILAVANNEQPTEASNVIYPNPDARRTWMVGGFPPNYEKGAPLINVEVVISNAENEIIAQLISPHATWNRHNHKWTFLKPTVILFHSGQPASFLPTSEEPLVIDNWSETPWQLIKPGLKAKDLGIPDLTTWLEENEAPHHLFEDPSRHLTHWHYRWALPFSCLVTVMLAAPLSIHFSRRGSSGGIAIAILLSGLMLLTGNVALALGESGTIKPILAAWIPNLIFTLVALYLFHRRTTGRPIYQTLLKLFPTDGN